MKGQKTIITMVSILIVFSVICYVLTNQFLLNYLLSTPYVFTPLIWVGYCLAEGVLHAYFYAHQNASTLKENFNEHPIFMAMRACVLIPLGAWLSDGMAVFAFILVQPFIHNGMYYYWRFKVDGHYGSWLSQSRTSTAITTNLFTPLVRIACAVVGVTVFILSAFDLINTDF